MTPLEIILSFVISLAANASTESVHQSRERMLNEVLHDEDALRNALDSRHSLYDELRAACAELAQNRTLFHITPQEASLWQLLTDDIFQAELTGWFMAGGIEEGNAVKDQLLQTIEVALYNSGANEEQVAFLKTDYFNALERTIFSHPILANWRHQLSLDYLRNQVTTLRMYAEEAAGVYSSERQKTALDHYCEKALSAWDIIDLSNLPEGDIHMATQKLLLRQLYMPLRITVEKSNRTEDAEVALAKLEEQREARRHRAAGHLLIDEFNLPFFSESRSPVGERLNIAHRLVVLGDPGGGKTTMLRWMATAYLLRYKEDEAFNQIPDTASLPDRNWIPVLIRCRDLGDADLCRSFTDFLTQHLHKTDLIPEEADVMRVVILDHIAKGNALLLVDGLDEIANPRIRTMFCQELERTAARYPEASIVVTSRIVGYRDMPYRMGSGFEHAIIAELNREDMDLFARRWVAVTEQHQSDVEKEKRALELLEALHSNDRIERLTGNPMLLTTLALVKRKVGKLPNRRNKLYAEAVSVLLNWNPRLYQTIEEDEAMPQLEYLAYEMCRRGKQRLTDDEVLDLLDKLRIEYPNIRAIRRREPQAFLEHLEARSSILIKSGGIWKNTTKEKPVWEFRHLTFQEYLAARALIDGKYSNRDKNKSLAEQVAPLAGVVKESKSSRSTDLEVEVPESWRETLRLLVADCKDDDVDDVLLAILKPMESEDAGKTRRSRAVLAALCLADEPNVSEEVAEQVLAEFSKMVRNGDGQGSSSETTVDFAAIEVGRSIWADNLYRCLLDEMFRRDAHNRISPGDVFGVTYSKIACSSTEAIEEWQKELGVRLEHKDPKIAAAAALIVMELAFEKKDSSFHDIVPNLHSLLVREPPLAQAAAWALLWLCGGWYGGADEDRSYWVPNANDVDYLVKCIENLPNEEAESKRYLGHIIARCPCSKTTKALVGILDNHNPRIRQELIRVIGQLGDKQAVEPLLHRLDSIEVEVQLAIINALGQLGDKQAVEPLLHRLDAIEVEVQLA
ncbi:MAG: HEAT repeat domain-containing protein, partial [Armatimonadota bacterium]